MTGDAAEIEKKGNEEMGMKGSERTRKQMDEAWRDARGMADAIRASSGLDCLVEKVEGMPSDPNLYEARMRLAREYVSGEDIDAMRAAADGKYWKDFSIWAAFIDGQPGVFASFRFESYSY